MILYTSDLHFGHSNVIRFDHRPFADVDEMDHVLIELWNGRVQPDDTVYIVGDFCYRSEHPAEWYLRQLKGHKFLVLGNHDHPILENPKALHYLEGVDKMMNVKDGDYQISLCHYPIVEWNAYYRGSYHIYGHIHNRKDEAYEVMKKKDHALNAGCMINNYTPASFKELVRNNEVFKGSGGCWECINPGGIAFYGSLWKSGSCFKQKNKYSSVNFKMLSAFIVESICYMVEIIKLPTLEYQYDHVNLRMKYLCRHL